MKKHVQFALAGAGLGLVIGVTIFFGRTSFPAPPPTRAVKVESNSGASPAPFEGGSEKIASAETPKKSKPAAAGPIPGVDYPGGRISENLEALLRDARTAGESELPGLWRRWLALTHTPDAIRIAWFVGSSIATPWMLADPKEAMAAIESLPQDDTSHALRHGLAQGWFKVAPARTIDWVYRWPPSSKKNEMLRDFAATWAVVDREAAYAFALTLTDAKLRADFISRFVSVWTPHSHAEASQWINTWPEENRQLAIMHASRLLARQNSADAIKLAQQYPGTSSMDAVIAEWADNNPSAAARWLDAQPRAERPPNAVVHIAEQWSRFDLEATGAWLARVEPGGERDRAVGIYAARLAQSDPPAAHTWAEQITDEKLREEALAIVAGWSESSSDGNARR